MAMMPMMEMIPLTPDVKPMLIGIMNNKYPHALGMYVRYYGKKGHCEELRLIGLTENDFVVTYMDQDGAPGSCTLSFVAVPDETEISCTTVGAARRAFVEMARHAAEKLGETIDLPPPSDPPPAGAADPSQMASMAAMMEMMKGKGKGTGGYEAPSGPSGNIRTLSGSSSGGNPMADMMAAMMAAKGKGKGKPDPTPVDPWAGLGEGNRLDGGSSAPANAEPQPAADGATTQAADVADLAAQVVPFDPDAPAVSLRVQLPDKHKTTVKFNSNRTIGNLRAYLQVNFSDHFAGPYNLMDTGGFPPKKLADLTQTLDEAGVKDRSSLDCRKS